MAKFGANNKGRPKGAKGKIPTKVKASLADLMDGELEKLTNEIKKLTGTAYIDYMLALLPYVARKQPSENQLTVSPGPNLNNPELANLSLDARRQIRDIMLADSQTKLIDA